ncbi:MAG: ABC transporter permease [Candidatus Aminicenantes bacterium]
MLILKMAFRNMFRHRRRSILTGMSMMGGFVLAAIFIGWSDGSYNHIINTFTRNRLGHIQIHQKTYLHRPSLYKTIDVDSNITRTLEQTQRVESWAPRLYSAGLASVGEESAGVQIIGIDPEKEEETFNFDKKIVQGRCFSNQPSKETVLGQGLARILKADISDEMVIISQAADGSIANDLYRMVGMVSTGDDITDRSSFYLHLKDAQELLVLGGRVHEIAVTVKKLGDVRQINSLLNEKIKNPELKAVPWQIFARSFYEAMKADKEGMWWMLVIIVIIVAVGVLNTVLMSVLERQREYGVLKAVGTKPAQIVRLVLMEVTLMAVICIIIGAALGLAANSLLSTHGISLGEGFTYGGMKFDVLRSEVNMRSFTIPACTVIFCALVVSLFPAVKAARTEPSRTMRIH